VEVGTWTGNAVVSGDYVLLADRPDSATDGGPNDRGGLIVIDVSVPAAPRHVGYFGPKDGRAVALRGTTVFLGTRKEIAALDVSNAAEPRLTSTVESPSRRLALADGLLLSLGVGLDAIDVSGDDLSPVGSVDPLRYSRDIVVFGTQAVVVAGGAGVYRLDLEPARVR
jgi:hypothetical protein